ncbi:hypothetical protein [Paenimyroides viscosum]|uniref:Lipoprotein n=1 Tax=Paenimyroides viscosum TaxID=2488729 RepID=A0A3P1AVR0_9FLAO|nr:hypothetical protein [Paenimyroides viscosum]RRA92013.1 hypothetical protein EG242_12125 [Paenimyroides viscosum]
MRVLIVLVSFMLFGCTEKNEIEEMVLITSYYSGHDRYNANFYVLKNFNENISLINNIAKQDTVNGFVINIAEEEKKKLSQNQKINQKQLLLAKVKIKLKQSKKYTDFRNTYSMQSFGMLRKPCYFYEIFDEYQSFEIIELYDDGLIKEG